MLVTTKWGRASRARGEDYTPAQTDIEQGPRGSTRVKRVLGEVRHGKGTWEPWTRAGPAMRENIAYISQQQQQFYDIIL